MGGGGGAGSGGLPSGITFGRVPLPVTLRLIHPPPKMTQGVMTPLTPFITFNASLSGVARCWHSNAYFSLFSSLFFLPDAEIFYGEVSLSSPAKLKMRIRPLALGQFGGKVTLLCRARGRDQFGASVLASSSRPRD
jgi:hypothetical protein